MGSVTTCFQKELIDPECTCILPESHIFHYVDGRKSSENRLFSLNLSELLPICIQKPDRILSRQENRRMHLWIFLSYEIND